MITCGCSHTPRMPAWKCLTDPVPEHFPTLEVLDLYVPFCLPTPGFYREAQWVSDIWWGSARYPGSACTEVSYFRSVHSGVTSSGFSPPRPSFRPFRSTLNGLQSSFPGQNLQPGPSLTLWGSNYLLPLDTAGKNGFAARRLLFSSNRPSKTLFKRFSIVTPS
jgi:hypothetical protein